MEGNRSPLPPRRERFRNHNAKERKQEQRRRRQRRRRDAREKLREENRKDKDKRAERITMGRRIKIDLEPADEDKVIKQAQ